MADPDRWLLWLRFWLAVVAWPLLAVALSYLIVEGVRWAFANALNLSIPEVVFVVLYYGLMGGLFGYGCSFIFKYLTRLKGKTE